MLRVATLNLLHNPDALPARVEHLITELITEDLDFLLLQEVLPPAEDGYFAVQHLALALGMPYVLFVRTDGRTSGNAILSKHELAPIGPPEGFTYVKPAAAATMIDGRRVVVISHHGAWGPHAIAERTSQARSLSDLAHHLFTLDAAHLDTATRPVIILGGDFNAVPDSAPIRYLTGLDHHLGHSTMWIDAAVHAGDPGHTTGDPNAFSIATAAGRRGAPYRPERTPRRRIDYLFVYEWVHGQAGEPVSGRRIAMTPFTAPDGRELTVSDHYGVLAHLWMPGDE